jgi:hypothetical protein
MRASKFAPITASLLARKGEARPWFDPASQPDHVQDNAILPENAWRTEPVLMPPLRIVESHDAGDDGRDRRVSLRMTSEDYAALGLLAARQGSTRQKFLYAALRRILEIGMAGPAFGR